MTHLRKIMLEELQRRHYSEATTHYYIRHVERFARYFHCSPDRLLCSTRRSSTAGRTRNIHGSGIAPTVALSPLWWTYDGHRPPHSSPDSTPLSTSADRVTGMELRPPWRSLCVSRDGTLLYALLPVPWLLCRSSGSLILNQTRFQPDILSLQVHRATPIPFLCSPSLDSICIGSRPSQPPAASF